MIVVDNGKVKGFTVFFPGALANGRTFRAMELDSAKRYAVLHLVAQFLMIGIWTAERDSMKSIPILSAITFIYVIWRIAMIKRVSVNVVTEKTSFSLAPVSIWLDHFSMFIMLLLGLLFANGDLMPPYDLGRALALFGAVFLAFIGLAPLWSYFIYRKKKAQTVHVQQ